MPPTGIPTVYKGRQFRSRLEARWAAFFDLIHWPFEYEPFDLKGWIPDFILLGKTEVLVEVKPVTEFPEDVSLEVERSGSEREVLLLGCAVPARPIAPELEDPWPIGWLHMPSPDGWYSADAFLVDWTRINSSLTFGLCGDCGPPRDRISGEPRPSQGWTWGLDPAVQLWARAGNLTQWRGKQSIIY